MYIHDPHEYAMSVVGYWYIYMQQLRYACTWVRCIQEARGRLRSVASLTSSIFVFLEAVSIAPGVCISSSSSLMPLLPTGVRRRIACVRARWRCAHCFDVSGLIHRGHRTEVCGHRRCVRHILPYQSPVAISSWTDDVVVTSLGLCDCLERRCCSEVPEEGGRPGRVLPHAYSPPWYYGYHLKMLEGRSCRSKTTGSDAASRAQLPPTWPVRMLAWSRVQPNLQEPNTGDA